MSERIAPECGCATEGKIVRGMCKRHYDRWVQSTPKGQRSPAPRLARDFWDFVDQSGECWIWTGPTNPKGYGWWSGGGVRGLAHRISLSESTHCPDDELFACHHCDNPPCVNPAHLYWGTRLDNARDLVERIGVHNKGVFSEVCKDGHRIEGDNLRMVGRNQKRVCRECDNRRSRERQQRLREADRDIAS